MSAQRWQVPSTTSPVRARVTVPASVTQSPSTDGAVAVAFAAAGLITGGTVLVRNWPTDLPAAESMLMAFSDMGGYVVSSADGLTVTGRSTSGALAPITVASGATEPFTPLLLVTACLATGPSVFLGTPSPADLAAINNLRRAGADIGAHSDRIEVSPQPLRSIEWTTTTPILGLTGLLTGLVVNGVAVSEWDRVENLWPGVASEWSRMISADEYLVPGSARLPRDYLGRASYL
ncbi:hypothetical protein RND64_22470 [Gordonia sp. w5E2]|uniref:hypothetical protein n=1 Tax=Gordonia TaxID=2053 RepID=UPI0009D4FC9D|nr:hypothetical protein [Gordonia jacobaea]SKY00858.1 3-phosphoshikimate 1-carboxyvinyltransferase [Mycobacteroides abscessus subsp. abscessus]